ncbi:N-acyl homoserine lactonase family protein [Rhodococcus sp. (in: high G+C Gram-positive bacteria)]|uniref:N-acyl homoserine lactonase family protein n=1 Tax=Rhodococcus baikonurensis TaxID=172041 RepID=A0ABV5XFL1_9NOCA
MQRTDTATTVRMWALEGGTLTFDGALLVLGGTGRHVIPVPTFLIQHSRGLVLFDTGLSPEAADDVETFYGPMSARVEMSFSDHQRVDRNLERLGFSTDEVTHVVLSHCHYDHTGGLHLFPNAKILVGEGEVAEALSPNSPFYRSSYRLEDLESMSDFDWNHLTEDYDLFADGSVRILLTPGHTRGHLSMLMRLDGGSLLLTGDATHLRCGLEQIKPMGHDYSTNQAVESLYRIRRFADAHAAQVWINHDPDDWNHYGPGPVVLGQA